VVSGLRSKLSCLFVMPAIVIECRVFVIEPDFSLAPSPPIVGNCPAFSLNYCSREFMRLSIVWNDLLLGLVSPLCFASAPPTDRW